MENPMVERVAQAIHAERCKVASPCPAWENATPILHDTARALARAAIEAMREPDGSMHEALSELGRALVRDTHERDQWCWFAVKGHRAMIDAALSPGEQDG